MKIAIVGAGAWGTALAISAARAGHAVQLFVRDEALALELQHKRSNAKYLPGHSLPAALQVLPGHAQAAAQSNSELHVIATPMAGLRLALQDLQACQAPLVWLCKGFDTQGLLGHEIARQAAPGALTGLLSGPSFAQEVASGQPTALVAASASTEVQEKLVTAFHGASLRVYRNSDVIGVEVGGAVKNVLAIATGLCDGLALGLNARAALITRGLAEMTRLGLALGAKPETFMGLTGLGDLVLTATGDLSRNRQVGQLLARGYSSEQATDQLGHVAEGVRCAPAVAARAAQLGVDMPITRCVCDVLAGLLSPSMALQALLSREPATE